VHTGEVTSGSTVRDPRLLGEGGDGPAAGCAGGDAGSRDQVAVPGLPAARAVEVAPGGGTVTSHKWMVNFIYA
jgi:hypothetical protein